MFRTLNFLLLLLLCSAAVLAQSTGFRYITKSQAAQEGELIKSGEKYDIAYRIYQELVEARGDYRFPVPAFYISPAKVNVAFLEGDAMSIAIEETAFEICKKQGDQFENALAALIGHELTHFYEKHTWRQGFASAYASLKIGMKLDSVQDKVVYETQSDYLGGFLAYSAGYPVYKNLPNLLEQIYKEYNLPNEMKGYPVLADRQALATKSMEKLDQLVEVFEMANLMAAVGRYDEARAYYKHVLRDYQGREIYNNLGIVTVLDALNYFTKQELKFRLPLELDLNFSKGSRSGYTESERLRKALLEEAIRYFDYAISMDADYAPAYLNKACAYYLLDDLPRARFYAANEALEKANANPKKFPKTAIDAQTLIALVEQKSGNELLALSLLTPLAATNSSVAIYNLAVLQNKTTSSLGNSNGPEDEEIDGVSSLKVFTRNNRDKYIEQKITGDYDFRKWDTKSGLKNSVIYLCRPPRSAEKPNMYFHLTGKGYTGETFDGYKIGTEKGAITKTYGDPKLTLGLPSGELMIYRDTIFFLDKDGKVERWAIYYTE
ncbi:MAG: hypothetical protein R2828_07945 [Saprospiraceae bacterium]